MIDIDANGSGFSGYTGYIFEEHRFDGGGCCTVLWQCPGVHDHPTHRAAVGCAYDRLADFWPGQ